MTEVEKSGFVVPHNLHELHPWMEKQAEASSDPALTQTSSPHCGAKTLVSGVCLTLCVPLHPRGCYSRLTQRPCFQYPVRFHWAIQVVETELWSRQHEALYKKYILKQSQRFWLLNWDFQALFTFIQRRAGGLGWRFHGHSTRGQYDRLRNYLLYPGHHTETERARGPLERLQNI